MRSPTIRTTSPGHSSTLMATSYSSTGGTGSHMRASAGTGGSGSAEQLKRAMAAPSTISEYSLGKTLGQGTFGKVCFLFIDGLAELCTPR